MTSLSTTQAPPPKALLFDIGGVCVLSPFRAILDYETSLNIPPGWVNFSISRLAPNGAWHRLERGEIPLDAAFFAAFNADLRNESLWRDHCARAAKRTSSAPAATTTPPLPDVDAERMFWEMMRVSREPDPHMLPALRALKASNRFVLGALTNAVIFPDGHPYAAPPADPDRDVRAMFDVWVSSAHVGLRKPDPRIYELALDRLRERWAEERGGGGEGLQAGEVVFLDDIGENLRQARRLGMRTVKVELGRTREAVRELERLTGVRLLDEEARL